ncbi:protein TIFY 5A-like [Musa acuminata AAA Group]|uniref:protein TIFY 5A-like n=1 Tax=Musa acuminata AAA Group TaxID=214697 RepID=UPI0031DE6C95
MMGVGCNPIDLRLRLGSSSSSVEESFGNSGETQQQQQQITIFYDGRICTCQVTEMEARNIISMAEREMDDQMRKKNEQSSLLSPQQKPDSAELSMIRSLQQFLQNRKSRQSALPPYNHRLHPMFPVKS